MTELEQRSARVLGSRGCSSDKDDTACTMAESTLIRLITETHWHSIIALTASSAAKAVRRVGGGESRCRHEVKTPFHGHSLMVPPVADDLRVRTERSLQIDHMRVLSLVTPGRRNRPCDVTP